MNAKNKISDIYQLIRKLLRIFIGKEVYFPLDIKIKKKLLGNFQAQWAIADEYLDENKVIYSFGVGTDISFDTCLIEKYDCNVFAFDPTPRSIEWIHRQNLPDKFKFYQYGISDKDGVITFFPPLDSDHVSFSTKAIEKNQKGMQLPVYCLKSIMDKLGHSKIDVLKIDVEGSEYNVIKDLIKSNISIKQMLVEFHHRFGVYTKEDTRNAINNLRKIGYKIFYVSPTGEEYSFIKLDE